MARYIIDADVAFVGGFRFDGFSRVRSLVVRMSFFCVGIFGADSAFFIEGGLARKDCVVLTDG